MMTRVGVAGWVVALGLGWAAGCSSETDTGGAGQGAGAGGQPFAGVGGAGGAPLAGTGGEGGGAGAMAAAGGAGGAGDGGPAGGAGGEGGMAGQGGASGTGGAGGEGGTAGEAGAAGMGGEAGTELPADRGEGDGKDVVTIGDSWMRLIVSGIEPSLDKYAGKTYRHRAQAGTLVLNEQIPYQYEVEHSANPDIKTVVMTGGGNDILGSPCSATACNAVVDDVFVRLNELYAQMAEDGVQDVIVVGYTYPANMAKHAALDHSIMRNEAECTKERMPRCHFIDGSKLGIKLSDGIHPDGAGYDLLGKTVWERMVAEGIRR